MKFIDLKAQYNGLRGDVNDRIQRVLEHGQYINGPEVGELEGKLAEFVGVKHAIGVSSGTDALTISLMALGIEPGDEVIMPGFTYIATAETVAFLGAKPIFVDIDAATYNIDPALIEAAITSKTKCIMVVSLYGQCADFDQINQIAARHSLPVIEDGAQSFGATYHGRRSCGQTTLGTTSFFPSKPLGCYGDGGAIFTNSDELALACRQVRAHGEERRYHHVKVGMNGRLDTLQAAILLSKLSVFEAEIEMRQVVAERYFSAFEDTNGITLPHILQHNESVYAQFTVRVADRDAVRGRLQDKGVPTAVHYPLPIYRQPAYAETDVLLETADQAAREVVSLPFSPWLEEGDQMQVVESLKKALA